MNILVVDDDEMIRMVLEEKLQEMGFTATTADSGPAAISLVADNSYDAVLLDLKMPGMDGIETLQELQKIDHCLPVIMVSSFGDIASAVQAIKMGAYEFVEKPPQISRIVLTLRRAIEKATLEREVKQLAKNLEETDVLRSAYEKLKELDQMKTSFIASVSHELRTPLTSIIGYAEIVRIKFERMVADSSAAGGSGVSEATQINGHIERLISETKRLAGLVESVLELAQLESGTIELKQEPLQLQKIIQSSAREFAMRFADKGLSFTCQVDDDLPLIQGDDYYLAKVVHNLFSNALKFTERGTVACRVRATGKMIMITLSDSGKGIAPGLHKGIFDKFSQIGDVMTDKPKGIGLGLPIAKMIVARHGGSIAVDSQPGRGSIFTVMLPVERGGKG